MIDQETLSEMSIGKKAKEWARLSKLLRETKENEMILRKEVCRHILESKRKGSKTKIIGQLKLTATASLNKKIEDEQEFESIYQDLTQEEQDCIKYKPTISETNLNLIDKDSQLFMYIEEKPGTPSLAIKAELDLEESPLKNL